jgi:hypothetical protein
MASTGTQSTLNKNALQASLRGELIGPGDNTYDNARALWNGMIDKKPALIARCKRMEDIVATVNFAREQDLTALGWPAPMTVSSSIYQK